MKYKFEPFENYFVAANKAEKEILNEQSPLMSGLRRYFSFFVENVFSETSPLPPIQVMLAAHSFLLYLGSIRVAMSGHGAAMFPLLRTVLEASCYAFLVGDSIEHQKTWLNRNSSPEALRVSKRMFGSAVREASKRIQEKTWVAPNTDEWINEAYDQAIDFGAHPNPNSVWPYTQIKKQQDEHIHVSLAGVYGPGSFETDRCLMACLDYGLVIAVILTSCGDEPSQDALTGLQQLNELKEKLTKNYFSV